MTNFLSPTHTYSLRTYMPYVLGVVEMKDSTPTTELIITEFQSMPLSRRSFYRIER